MSGVRKASATWAWVVFFKRSCRPSGSWYPGDALDTTVFVETGPVTSMTVTVLHGSREARDTARRSGMEHGMVAGYNRLEEMLSSMLADGAP